MSLITLPLPVLAGNRSSHSDNASLFPPPATANRLPAVEWSRGQGPLLDKNPFGSDPDVRAIHLVGGCAQQCSFCWQLPERGDRGQAIVRLREGAAQQLHAELSRTVPLPRAVYLSPHSDPFPPLAEVQAQSAAVIDVLGRHGVQCWIITRGYIRPAALEVLSRYRRLAKIMVGFTTADRVLQRLLEPLSAPPRLRLRQMRRLGRQGFSVQAALEPLVPGLTDTRENLSAALEALAEAGVKRVTAGYLFLTAGTAERLQERLAPLGKGSLVLDPYADGVERRVPDVGRVRLLPRSYRQQGYARLMSLAAAFGISVSISPLSNPDFTKPEPKKVFAQGYLPGLWQPEKAGVG